MNTKLPIAPNKNNNTLLFRGSKYSCNESSHGSARTDILIKKTTHSGDFYETDSESSLYVENIQRYSPYGLHDEVGSFNDDLNNVSEDVNAMATHANRHSVCCCLYNGYLHPRLLYYIKPLVEISVLVLCLYGMSCVMSQYNNLMKSCHVLSINMQEIKNEIELLVSKQGSESRRLDTYDSQINDISKILEKLTNLTNNTLTPQYKSVNPQFDLIYKNTYNLKDVFKTVIYDYNADKTARSDYALESAGGQILSILSTQPYIIESGSALTRIWNYVLGFMCSSADTARPILQPTVSPGQCWAFKSSRGAVMIKLLAKIYITGVTLEHIPASISPTKEISSAPKTFSLWGLEDRDNSEGFFFGEFTYKKDDQPIQYFETQIVSHIPYEIVILKIHSNWGNPEYTCVYRVRIHGKLK